MNRTIRRLDRTLLSPVSGAAIALKASPLKTVGEQAAALVSTSLGTELKCPIGVEASIFDAPAAAAGLPEGCCFLVLALGADGRRAVLEVQYGIASALVARLSGGQPVAVAPQPPTEAEIAALSFLALHGLRAVRAIPEIEKALSPRFLFLARDGREVASVLAREREWVAIDLVLTVGDVVGAGRLLIGSPTARRIARSANGTAARADFPGHVGWARLDATLGVGGASLTQKDLERLAVGDVVVVSSLSRTEVGLAGDARLNFKDFQLVGRLEAGHFTLASVVDAVAPEALMHDKSLQVSSLPIEVHVELARLKVPLHKLQNLNVGGVLDLDVALTDAVLLRVGDRVVAQAELVDINGELGARIVSLLP